jgi:predicted ATP-grasp superfamily ATP-dependent carboligase
VVIAESTEQADAAAREMLGGRFGAAGAEIVIEEFLRGEEASFIVMADGEHVLALASSRTTSDSRTAIAVPTPAAWAPIRPRRCSHRRCMSG